MRTFEHTQQQQITECGPACLKMVLDYFTPPPAGYDYSLLCSLTMDDPIGTTVSRMVAVLAQFKLEAKAYRAPLEYLYECHEEPVILLTGSGHYCLAQSYPDGTIRLSDPAAPAEQWHPAAYVEKYWLGEQPNGIVIKIESHHGEGISGTPVS